MKTYSGPLWKVAGSCLACAALARASRLMTVRLVGVIDVLGPPARSGLLRPTPVTGAPSGGGLLVAPTEK